MKFYINKECYFFVPTKKNPAPDDALERVEAIYVFGNKYVKVGVSFAIGLIENVKFFLEKLITKNKQLNALFIPYQVGYQWNISYYNHCNEKESPLHKVFLENSYWLFSIGDMGTWAYTIDDKMIIEIAPSYPWSDMDPEKNEQVETFETFMKRYKPIAIHEISKETAQKWIKQADDYINIVEAQYPEWCKKNRNNLYVLRHDA